MDRWTTLEPVRLHGPSNSTPGKPIGQSTGRTNASHAHQNRAQFIGRLPSELHLLIFHFLALPDIPRYARANRAISRIAGDERLWERRWNILAGFHELGSGKLEEEAKLDELLRELEQREIGSLVGSGASAGRHVRNLSGSVDLGSLGSPTRTKPSGVYHNPAYGSINPTTFTAEDEFGDFANADLASDEFDDFVGAPPATSRPAPFPPLQTATFPTAIFPSAPSNQSFSIYSSESRKKFKRAYVLLRPLLPLVHPSTPPHTLLSLLLPTPPPPPQAIPSMPVIKEPSLSIQARLLALMTRFLSLTFQPCRDWEIKSHSLRACVDIFDSGMLKLFEDADGKKDEGLMRDAAWASWEVHTVWSKPQRKKVSLRHGPGARTNLGFSNSLERLKINDWELVKVWIERREEFYVHGEWDPSTNVTSDNQLSFDPMDSFMSYIITSLSRAANTTSKVFPADASALLLFADRLGNEIIAEYVNGLLARAREVDASNLIVKDGRLSQIHGGKRHIGDQSSELTPNHGLYLQATAAAFVVCWKVVDTITESASYGVDRRDAEAVIFRMFDPHMDEYLDEEVEAVKRAFDSICRNWSEKTSNQNISSSAMSPTRTRFLESHNPQQVKRNVVAGFTDVLMLPVTIIPRAVGAVAVGAGSLAVGAARTTGRLALGAATTTGSLAVGAAKSGIAGISMLNPTKWGGAADSTRIQEGYTTPLSNGDTDGSGYIQAKERHHAGSWLDEQEHVDWSQETSTHNKTDSIDQLPLGDDPINETPRASSSVSVTTQDASKRGMPSLDLFLSLDVALELIHAARDSMKRLESFFPPRSRHAAHNKSGSISKPVQQTQHWSVDGFPGPSGRRLRETLEEIFILLLIALRERHIEPGFERAIEQMRQYKPVDVVELGSQSNESSTPPAVAPILGFFELVHIGDTIGSMIQVYFDREMAPYIDINDFLSGIMREKKKFENSLDEEVAKGLNAGTEVLMTQVEHLLWSRTSGREYCPPEGTIMAELTPTRSCKEVIECLETHCRIVRGSTSREVLEVFYAEVGMRLHGLIQKHIKRQIVSLEGGIQVIADLNAYYDFVATLKVPHLVQEFANLKRLGHVFVVAEATDLAAIVRDATRYGGTFRPEDVYEFVQRRSDWKKIERDVDRTMYNLSFKEDCVIC